MHSKHEGEINFRDRVLTQNKENFHIKMVFPKIIGFPSLCKWYDKICLVKLLLLIKIPDDVDCCFSW